MTMQARAFVTMRAATHPLTIAELAMLLNVPFDSARSAVAALYKKDLVTPLRNKRRGQVWAADKSCAVPVDMRGMTDGSRVALGLAPVDCALRAQSTVTRV